LIYFENIYNYNMQAGSLYEIEKERKLEGRLFPSPSYRKSCTCTLANKNSRCTCREACKVDGTTSRIIDEMVEELENENQRDTRSFSTTEQSQDNPHLRDDHVFLSKNRRGLSKFEPLSIGDKTLTGISIGGYDIDLTAAAQKAREVLPLPPSKLPVIFLDQELNFYHHFFQGLESIFGKDIISEVTTIGYASTFLGNVMIEGLTRLVDAGYEKGDSEIVIFIKKTMNSTFEIKTSHCSTDERAKLLVVANLWGFQYIEPGMQCGPIDICMWLAMCYGHYKTLWFNTFKLTGVPEFSHSATRRQFTSTSTKAGLSAIDEDDQGTVHFENRSVESNHGSVSSRRSKRHHRRNNQVTRWISST
jgi:hypothetical protein